MNYKGLTSALLASSVMLAACGSTEEAKDTAKNAGKTVEEVTKDAEKKVEETTKKAGDKAKEASEKAKDAAKNAKNETATTETPDSTSNKELKNKTAILNDEEVKILDTELMPKGTYDGQTADQLVVTYEIKNKTDKKITPIDGYLAAFEATQEDDNSERKLDVGITPMNDKYKFATDVQTDNIKKGGTVKSAIAYDLKDMKTPVILHATKGLGGEQLGTIKVELEK